ncbi:MAG TPA: TolC family protein [Verrucomicrobiales bacterium]|nr:TolC family protein [Verrucomicrobiales bacterium]
MGRTPPSNITVFSLFLCTAALTGCAAIRYEARPLSPKHSAAAFAGRRLDPAVGRWSESALVRHVLAGHPDIALAKARVATARAAVETANTKPNPTAGFSPVIAANPNGATSPWAFGFTLDVPVETAGKRARRADVALAAVQAAALDAATAAFQTGDAVRHAFRDLAASTARVELLTKQQQAQEEVVKLYDDRVAGGAIARAETTQSRLLLQQTRVLVRDAEKKRAEARAALAGAAGVPVEALDRVSFDFSSFDQPPAAGSAGQARAHALQNRTDLLSALAAYAGAEATLRLEVAKQYPDIHLTPGYQYDQGTHKWSLPGLTAALPIFDRNRGPVMEAVAKRAEAGAAFVALQAKVSGEVDRALAALNGSRAKLAEAEKLVAEQHRQQQSVSEQQKAGAADKLTLASTTVELHAAELARLESLAESHQAALDLARATQSP